MAHSINNKLDSIQTTRRSVINICNTLQTKYEVCVSFVEDTIIPVR